MLGTARPVDTVRIDNIDDNDDNSPSNILADITG
jgi:hypothetical protein